MSSTNDSSQSSPEDSGVPRTDDEKAAYIRRLVIKAARTAVGRFPTIAPYDSEDIAQAVMMRIWQDRERIADSFWNNRDQAWWYILMAVKREIRNLRRHLSAKKRKPNREGARKELQEPEDFLWHVDIQDAIDSLPAQHANEIWGFLGRLGTEENFSGDDPPTLPRSAAGALKNALEKTFAAEEKSGSGNLVEPPVEVEPLHFDLYLNPGEASEADVRAVLHALNELHRASGGLGLEFRIDGTFLLARQGVPA
jgi:DNA-directed RNA polymerase specialized sigma24 family protein